MFTDVLMSVAKFFAISFTTAFVQTDVYLHSARWLLLKEQKKLWCWIWLLLLKGFEENLRRIGFNKIALLGALLLFMVIWISTCLSMTTSKVLRISKHAFYLLKSYFGFAKLEPSTEYTTSNERNHLLDAWFWKFSAEQCDITIIPILTNIRWLTFQGYKCGLQ